MLAGRNVLSVAQPGGIAAAIIEHLHITVGRQEPIGKPVSLPPRPALLAGREELLSELHARLTSGVGDGPRVIALHGLGGVGKTSIAVEYAHRHQAMKGISWQFPAEDTLALEAEFGQLAAQLSTVGPLDARDPVKSVHAVLAASSLPWLLIFDNAADGASVRRFLPPAGTGQVLITSQSSAWPPGQGLEVPTLATGLAAGFLTARTGDPDTQAATELAAELGGLPLAPEQAAAYIGTTQLTLAEYLSLILQRRGDLLSRGEVAGYGKNVATTWAVTFTRLEQDAPDAAGLLRLLAFLAPEPVPLTLLLGFPDAAAGLSGRIGAALGRLAADPLALGDALAALRRYSLVTPAGRAMLLVHRLVQAVTRDQMAPEPAEHWRQAAAVLTEAAIPDDAKLPENWPAYAALLPHAQAVLHPGSTGMGHVADYVGWTDRPAAACDLWQQILNARQHDLGPEDPATLQARAETAFWTGHLGGDAAAARDLYAALLPVRQRVSGTEHPETLNARTELARWTRQAGTVK